MKWLAVTRDSRPEVNPVSSELILQADQFPFSKSNEKVTMKKRCKGGTSVWFEGTVPDLAGVTGNDEGI
jgi:hypothetical protein